MATNKSPRNDFAPAWLKIPEGECSKPPGSKSSEHDGKANRSMRRDDYYNYNRYPPPDFPYQPVQRQRSFDNYYDDRRFNGPKLRHHSVDDDYYNGPPYNGYPYYNSQFSDKFGNGFRSHPSLYHDGKYQHPNARYSHVTGGYTPYYDPYFDYYGDGYYNGYAGRAPGSKRSYPGDRERHPVKGEKEKYDKEKTGPKNLNGVEEFPSLNGDVEPAEKSKVQNASGVWDKPLRSKPLSNGNSNVADGKNTDAKGSTNMYKVLVPYKGSFKKSTHSSAGNPIKAMKMNGSLADHSAGANSSSQSAPVEILSSQIKSRRLGDKKSNFLRQMKGSDANCNEVDKSGTRPETGEETTLCNGVNGLSVSPLEEVLSSSLEAEQRLLKEMGWNETDEEEYVITEDDMKEFQNLSKQLKERKNGMTKILPKTWSPTHLPTAYATGAQELNDTLSSTSDDDTDEE